MKKKILLAAISLACASVFAQNAALVNGKSIPKSLVDKVIASSGQPDTPELRNQVRESLVNETLILQEADRLSLMKDKTIKEQLERVKKNIMIAAVVDHYLNQKEYTPTETEIKTEYDKIKTASAGAKEYHIRHILVEKESDATAIIAKLQNGSKFEELAKASSKDQKTATNGGDLGWINPEGINPEFSRGISALKKDGDYSEKPINTPIGWHIIKRDSIRDFVLPPMEQVKPAVEQRVRMNPAWRDEKIQAIVKVLRNKAKIQ